MINSIQHKIMMGITIFLIKIQNIYNMMIMVLDLVHKIFSNQYKKNNKLKGIINNIY